MKEILFCALMQLFAVAFAQDTTFFDASKNEVQSIAQADYYSVKVMDSEDTNKVDITEYYTDGQIKFLMNYKNYREKVVDGKKQEWYRNGQLKSSIDYVENEINGQILTYWDDGSKKRIDNYKKDKFISGTCFNKQGIEVEHFRFFVMPYFEQCLQSKKKRKVEDIEQCTNLEIFKHIANTTRYPRLPRNAGVAGTVYIQFTIDTIGEVSRVNIVRGIPNGEKLNEEAIRVIKSLPKMMPGKQDGEKVNVQYTVPIRFQLR